MKITKKDVEHVAVLAKLELSEKEKEKFLSQLEEILVYMEKLNELDEKIKKERVEPLTHIVPIVNALREDAPQPSLAQADALKNSPEEENFFVVVPKIIEE